MNLIQALHTLLGLVIDQKAQELQLLAGAAPGVLLHGTVRPCSLPPLTPDDTAAFLRTVASRDQQQEFQEKGVCSFGLPFEKAHFFVTVFLHEGHCGLRLRRVPRKEPSSR